MKQLHIAEGLSLPLDIVTQVEVIIAKRRVGKSYTMRRILEQLLKAKEQVVLVDPKGDQWGIRSSADGKKPGYPVLILGGEHGDLPLEVSGGELVARLVVEERVSTLLDLSQFRKHEVATFMTAFLENLYRLKAQEKYRTPMKLVIDEADAIAPQKPQRGEERMLGAIEDIVRRGGQRGIGCTLVTQRSAVLNKNVLTQAQVLIVLRTIAPQDLAAMKAWIDVHGSIEEGKRLMDSLPSLPIGDAWFWSPGWPTAEGIFKRVHVLPIETFDSAATPAPGEKKVVPKNLADVNLDVLKKQMSETIEKAKNDDPKVLRKKISELEGQLKQRTVHNPVDSKAIEQKGYSAGVKATETAWRKEVEKTRALAQKEIDGLQKKLAQISKIAGNEWPMVSIKIPEFNMEKTAPGEIIKLESPKKNLVSEPSNGSGESLADSNIQEKSLGICGKKIYSFLRANDGRKFSKVQVAAVTGYSPNSGGFKNSLSELNTMGLIRRDGDMVSLYHVDDSYLLGDGETYSKTLWLDKLGKCEKAIYEVLLAFPESEFSREDLAGRTGYSVSSGGFKNSVSHLSSLGLLERTGAGVRLNEELLNL